MTTNIPKIDFSRLFHIWSEHKVNTLNDFRSTIDHSLSLEESYIGEKLTELETNRDKYSDDDFEDYKAQLGIDYDDLNLIRNLKNELSIIALYKTTELYVKRILTRAFYGKVKRKDIMEMDIVKIKKLLKTKQIDLEAVHN